MPSDYFVHPWIRENDLQTHPEGESQMKAEDILNALPINYYVVDLKQKKIVQSNDSSIKKLGQEPCFSQLFNKNSPCNVQQGKCLCQQLLENKNSAKFILETGEGEHKKIFRADVKKAGGDLVVATYSDITRETVSAKEMKINNRRLQRAEKLASFGSWEIDFNLETITFTQGAFDIYGLKKHTMSLEEAREIPLPEYRQKLDKVLEDLKTGEKTQSIQYKIKRRNDGEIRHIQSIAEYRDDKNMVFGVLQDITLSKKAENELEDSNNLLRTLIQNIPDAIYMKDNQYRKVIANNGDLRNCRVEKPEDVIGKTDYELFPKDVAEKYMEDDRQVLERGVAIINREEELPGNPKRWILTTKVPLVKDGQITGLVGIGHDITHRKKMMEELKTAKKKAEENDQLKSLFLANMSHEIRTPLNAILGFSNLLCAEGVEPDKREHFGKIIENSGKRLTTVIDDIIDISLIQSNQLKVKFDVFNINELLEELLALYKSQKPQKLEKLELKVRFCEHTKHSILYSDKNRIYQVLRNLLDNAFKFTEKGCIEFGCWVSENEHLVLFVKDTGIGIGEDKINLIFESFRQGQEGSTRQYEGTGLGLAIVSGIANQLGGEVWVESEPGQGSSFFVSLPRKKKEQPVQNEWEKNHREKEENSTVSKRIVSFEDDPASIEYLNIAVSSLGYELINFDHPPTGIEYLRNNNADLVLMDVRLPEMSGFEATKLIKSEFPGLPVIIQTAYAMKGDMEKASQAGSDDYLSKPVSLKDLKAKIKMYV